MGQQCSQTIIDLLKINSEKMDRMSRKIDKLEDVIEDLKLRVISTEGSRENSTSTPSVIPEPASTVEELHTLVQMQEVVSSLLM